MITSSYKDAFQTRKLRKNTKISDFSKQLCKGNELFE